MTTRVGHWPNCLGRATDTMAGRGEDAAPSAWAMRKEAKRNMYLTSTDHVRVQRRGLGGSSGGSAAAAQCQKCLQAGHWTYECKNDAVYVKRASRTSQLKNPKLRQPFNQDKPPETAEVEPEDKKKKKKTSATKRTKSKSTRKKRRSGSDSESDSSSGSSSSSSDSSSESESESGSSSSSSSDSSDDSDASSSSSASDDSRDARRRSKKRRRN